MDPRPAPRTYKISNFVLWVNDFWLDPEEALDIPHTHVSVPGLREPRAEWMDASSYGVVHIFPFICQP